jgi:hypothetical protein
VCAARAKSMTSSVKCVMALIKQKNPQCTGWYRVIYILPATCDMLNEAAKIRNSRPLNKVKLSLCFFFN